jgi:divalent metal cation (Fe/Co/Zn/Cd) transporter
MALAVYIIVTSGYNLLTHQGAERSLLGTLMALASLICMPILTVIKLRIAEQIDSAALKEDAMCSLTCAYTAGAVLVGNLLTIWQGWWWSDSIFSLLLVILIVKEGLEGIRA